MRHSRKSFVRLGGRIRWAVISSYGETVATGMSSSRATAGAEASKVAATYAAKCRASRGYVASSGHGSWVK